MLKLGGTPCLEREKAFIFAWMSWVRPLDLVFRLGVGPGLRAALIWPSGVEEGVIMGVSETDRMVRFGGEVGDETAPSGFPGGLGRELSWLDSSMLI